MAVGFSLTTWALASLCIMAAAFVRGFTGFGLAVVGVPLLSLFFAPAEIVPSIMILAILAGIQLLPKIWRKVDWRLLAPTLCGAAIGTPLGTALLAGVSANAMRVLIGAAVLIASAAIQLGFRFKQRPRALVSAGFGAVAGLTGGAAAMPGPSVIFLFLAAPATVGISSRQSTLRQTFGSSCSPARMARIMIEGTISAGAKKMLSSGTPTTARPKPVKPRTNAAEKMQRLASAQVVIEKPNIRPAGAARAARSSALRRSE